MRKLLLLLAALGAGLWLAPAGHAARVAGLYEAEVAVSAQDEAERQRGLREALEQVLVRVSGRRGVAGHSALREALSNPARLVQQFRYRPLPAPSEASAGEPSEPGEALWARFDAAAVNDALLEAGLPVWGRVRPAVVFWAALEREDGRRDLLRAGDDDRYTGAVVERADERGLPLVLPLHDLQDQSGLNVSDLWGDFREAIVEASGRYAGDGVLVARAARGPQGWEARWTLYLEAATERWSTRAGDLQSALTAGVDEAADLLAARFAQIGRPASPDRMELVVNGVLSLEDYARVLDYLESLDRVSEVDLLYLEPERAGFELALQADVQTVEQAMRLGRTLRLIDASGPRVFMLMP